MELGKNEHALHFATAVAQRAERDAARDLATTFDNEQSSLGGRRLSRKTVQFCRKFLRVKIAVDDVSVSCVSLVMPSDERMHEPRDSLEVLV